MTVGRREWSLHLTTDQRGNPEFAWITCEEPDGQVFWVADQEFGPFDQLHEVYTFLAKQVRAYRPVRPG